MRILVEAMAADFGGIRTYVERLLAAWAEHRPDDRVHVALPRGAELECAGHATHGVVAPRPTALGRPLAQTVAVRRLADRLGVDAVLATMPGTSLLGHRAPTAVVVHDLRHELRPEQFGRARRLVRRVSYGRAYAVADGFVAVSRRTLDDLHRLHPGTRSRPAAVVHHGADHVLGWPRPSRPGPAVAFGHHSNKRPELAVDAWAEGLRRGLALPDLLVVGTGGDRGLAARVAAHESAVPGLAGRVRLAPYLDDADFRTAFAAAAMVVLPSDFEGFGLPVVEGMLLGAPVVIGPEPALLEVASGHAVVAEGWSAPLLADALARALGLDRAALDAARDHAAGFTWRRTVEETRALLAGLAT